MSSLGSKTPDYGDDFSFQPTVQPIDFEALVTSLAQRAAASDVLPAPRVAVEKSIEETYTTAESSLYPSQVLQWSRLAFQEGMINATTEVLSANLSVLINDDHVNVEYQFTLAEKDEPDERCENLRQCVHDGLTNIQDTMTHPAFKDRVGSLDMLIRLCSAISDQCSLIVIQVRQLAVDHNNDHNGWTEAARKVTAILEPITAVIFSERTVQKSQCSGKDLSARREELARVIHELKNIIAQNE
jgi:hypothetical protein